MVCLGVLLPVGALAGQSIPSQELDPGSNLLETRDTCPGGISSEPVPLDRALFTSYDEVREAGPSKPPLLVDVRPPHRFEQFRIPGSLSVPLFALPTRGFLRSKRVVLVGEGHDTVALAGECRALLDSGFSSAAVLEGGLNRWGERGGPVEGDLFALAALNRISPAAFASGLVDAGWVVAGFGVGEEDRERFPSPAAVLLPAPTRPDVFLAAVCRLGQEGPGARLKTVVLFDQRGEGYAAAEAALGKLLETPTPDITVFYLDGGLAGYEAYTSRLAAGKSAPTAKRVKRCGVCP